MSHSELSLMISGGSQCAENIHVEKDMLLSKDDLFISLFISALM